jgi:iron complex outermembrane receptor protein
VIRSFDNFRVLMQENGIASHEVSALSEDHAVPIDRWPWTASRWRGPADAALRLAGDRRRGQCLHRPHHGDHSVERRQLRHARGLNSVDGGVEGAFKVTAGACHATVYADASSAARRRHAARQPIQHVRGQRGFALGTSLIGKEGFIGIAFSRFMSVYGLPGEKALEHRPYLDLLQDKLQARGEWRIRNAGLEAIRFLAGLVLVRAR